jgi:ATP-dependent DNA helicase RecG
VGAAAGDPDGGRVAPATLPGMDASPPASAAGDTPDIALLQTPLERLAGVGTARAERLARLGLVTVRDALLHFPRDYRDFTGAHAVADLRVGEHASLAGEVVDVGSRTTAAGRALVTVTIVCAGGGRVRAVWFGMPFLARRFVPGMRVVVAGQPRLAGGGWEFAHPEVRWLAGGEEPDGCEWLAVYPLADGVQQSHVRASVDAALRHAVHAWPEALPEACLREKHLLPIGEAIRQIHRPASEALGAAARRRFVYQELLMLQLALRMHRRHQREARAAVPIVVDRRLDGRIRARFPFAFTPAQDRVCGEIAADLARPEPMNRLVQGDVGSGKTAVAVYAMLAAVGTTVRPEAVGAATLRPDGRPERLQAALMAPTELLARQHLSTLERLLSGSGVEQALLVGGQPARQRERILARIASGETDIVVGTQALVRGAARFHRLGLVVIDEQHRFGVLQRAILQHGQADPHTLVMTATPIPRTIAHAVYGDLDVSLLDAAPPGRLPVATYRVGPAELERWWDFFRRKLAAGRRGYVVVPAVEESRAAVASIASAFEELANGPLEAFRLGLLHGRLPAKAKAAVMDDFRTGRLDALVATSVIEVGIDVPEATIMTILDAERFGLAQLHQLRGRVARGALQGICGAVTGEGDEPRPRVEAFVATTDGFELAERDFALRGPGDLVGTRQSGAPPLYLADLLRDTDVVAEARRDALEMFERDPDLADPALDRLRRVIIDRWGPTLGLGRVG